MDIATGKIANSLRALARRINKEKYGSDIDFNEKAFLEDLDNEIVTVLGGEIITD